MEYHFGTQEPTQKCSIPANLNQLPLQTEMQDTTMKLPGLFRDLIRGTRTPNHLMLRKEEMRVILFSDTNLQFYLQTSGHGSLSSLVSLGHLSSVSYLSEEKANAEIQKLQKELREEHEKVQRLSLQLSTNVITVEKLGLSCAKLNT